MSLFLTFFMGTKVWDMGSVGLQGGEEKSLRILFVFQDRSAEGGDVARNFILDFLLWSVVFTGVDFLALLDVPEITAGSLLKRNS